MKPTVGSLFAGIGGFDLGFERAGFEVKWQVEIDPWCRKVLAKNFPNAARYEDVRTVGAHNLSRVDVIAGGFPCQDISLAGTGAGIADGTRSGLWSEFSRTICELRPRFVLVENVSALLGRGMGRVLGDLAAVGYDAEWEIVSAADAGAPHLRERVWIVAYPSIPGLPEPEPSALLATRGREKRGATSKCSWWAVEPALGRVAHGIPKRVDRLRGLGNAVVPQIPEMYARRIKETLASGL